MGRKTTKEATIKIRTNPVRGRRGNAQCAEELQQFFVCMAVRETLVPMPLLSSVVHFCTDAIKLYCLQKSGGSNINTACSKEIQALRSCAAAAVRDCTMGTCWRLSGFSQSLREESAFWFKSWHSDLNF